MNNTPSKTNTATNPNRRHFLKMTGMAAGAAVLSPLFAFAGPPVSSRKVRVGVVGGRFGSTFHFEKHPNVTVEAVSDLIPERRRKLMEVYKCEKSHESLEILLRDPKIEAVALFTPAPDHARHVMQSLNAGKHVLCAVPAALTLEEAHQVLQTVKRTGLKYMMAETTTYRLPVISAKKFHKEGLFGDIFSSASQYYHPGLETLWFEKDGTPTWRHGLPPMLYPTHVTAHLIAVTGERLVTVSCNGWGDDSRFLKNNVYKNPFWNESASFRTNKGNTFFGEVCWRGALVGTERGEWRGDKMSFYAEYKGLGDHKVFAGETTSKDDGGFAVAKARLEKHTVEEWHKTDLLPEAMRIRSGHGNSHCFITHEFIDSIVSNREPLIDIHEALAYTVPGIIAHESALRDGEQMKIPSFD